MDHTELNEKLKDWEEHLLHYRLPDWDAIPDLGLYMEQVLVLLKQYLDFLPSDRKEDPLVTAAAINNYVRQKTMPEPVKKRYYRIHIAYLLMICSLKQSLSIAQIRQLIPAGLTAEETERLYATFAERHQRTSAYFARQVREQAEAPDREDPAAGEGRDMILSCAIVGGFARALADRLLVLPEDKDKEKAKEKEKEKAKDKEKDKPRDKEKEKKIL